MVLMAKKWTEIINDPDFKALSTDEKKQVAQGYFDNVIAKDKDFNALGEPEKQQIYEGFNNSFQQSLSTYIS